MNSAWESLEDNLSDVDPVQLAFICLFIGAAFGVCLSACCCFALHRQHSAPLSSEPYLVSAGTGDALAGETCEPCQLLHASTKTKLAPTPCTIAGTQLSSRDEANRVVCHACGKEESCMSEDAEVAGVLPKAKFCGGCGQPVATAVAKADMAMETVVYRLDVEVQTTQTSRLPARLVQSSAQTTAVMDTVRETGLVRFGEPVILHIYDVATDNLKWVNGMLRNVGTGVFHAGVEVFGSEWSFGYSEKATGVHSCKPRGNPYHQYREQVFMMTTPLTESEVKALVQKLSDAWPGRDYDVLTRNCCHFSDALCQALSVGEIPQWVLRLAGDGARFKSAVDTAVFRAQAAADAMAARASEIDEQYKISSAMDGWVVELEKPIDQYGHVESGRMWQKLGQAATALTGELWNALPKSAVPMSEAQHAEWLQGAVGEQCRLDEHEFVAQAPGSQETRSTCILEERLQSAADDGDDTIHIGISKDSRTQYASEDGEDLVNASRCDTKSPDITAIVDDGTVVDSHIVSRCKDVGSTKLEEPVIKDVQPATSQPEGSRVSRLPPRPCQSSDASAHSVHEDREELHLV